MNQRLAAGIWLWLFGLGSLASAVAQDHNGELIQAWLGTRTTNLPPVQQVRSFLPRTFQPDIVIDSSSQERLILGPAAIEYEKIGRGQFLRSIELPLQYAVDSTRSDTFLFADTLSYWQMRRVIQRSPEKLQGEDPTFQGRWALPFASILLGTGLTISLFYLRSRR